MHSQSHVPTDLWRTTCEMLYQSGEVQTLLTEGADKSEIQLALCKVIELATQGITQLDKVPKRSMRSQASHKAVVLPDWLALDGPADELQSDKDAA